VNNSSASALQCFEQVIGAPEPDWDAALALLTDLEKQGGAEEAQARLRHHRMPKGVHPPKLKQLKIRLGVAAEKARDRRCADTRLDAERGILRLRYGRGEALAHLNPAQFLSLLARVLHAADLAPSLSLERTPRPLVALGHPLPVGLSGRSEWADAEISPMPKKPEEALLTRLNTAAPAGLAFSGATTLPAYATPALELSRLAHWRWPCPADFRHAAGTKIEAFNAATTFCIEKMGKVDGQKSVKQVEVRHQVAALSWEGGDLSITTRISAKAALNPQKLLAGILGLETSAIKGMERISVELAEDQRIQQAERFEPKLHNIFEDAVLLSSGPSLQIIDDDDDEPMHLG
jgi:radical SAM-linked protein